MKTKLIFSLVFLLGCLAILNAQPVKENAKAIDYETLAQKLVNQCAGIKQGDFVLINGGSGSLELLEDIAVNVRKLGAFPLISIGSDRLTRRFYTDVPSKFYTQSPEMDLKLFGFANAVISVDYNEAMDLLADIPAEQRAAISNAYKPANDLFVKRAIRGVNLGNGLYPTEMRAKQFGMTLNELSTIFWSGVNVDYTKLEASGESIKAIFAKGKEVQITNANGTDLKMSVEARKVFVSDGITSPEDLKNGFASSQVYLPAGEVYMAPVPGTANGKVVIDQQFFQGKEIKGITLLFENGKLTSMTAKSGLEQLKAMYDAASTGKEELGFIDIGINPNVKPISGSNFVAWMLSGMITIGTGNNEWAGGNNTNPYSFNFFLPGSSLKVDGNLVIDKGILKY